MAVYRRKRRAGRHSYRLSIGRWPGPEPENPARAFSGGVIFAGGAGGSRTRVQKVRSPASTSVASLLGFSPRARQMAGSSQGQPPLGLERGPGANARRTDAFLTPRAGPTPGRPGGRDPPQGVSSAQAALGSHCESGCLLVGSCWLCILVRGGCSPARSRFSALPVETSTAPCRYYRAFVRFSPRPGASTGVSYAALMRRARCLTPPAVLDSPRPFTAIRDAAARQRDPLTGASHAIP